MLIHLLGDLIMNIQKQLKTLSVTSLVSLALFLSPFTAHAGEHHGKSSSHHKVQKKALHHGYKKRHHAHAPHHKRRHHKHHRHHHVKRHHHNRHVVYYPRFNYFAHSHNGHVSFGFANDHIGFNYHR